jgi:hypothetical protein
MSPDVTSVGPIRTFSHLFVPLAPTRNGVAAGRCGGWPAGGGNRNKCECREMSPDVPIFAKWPNEANSCSCIPNGDQCSLLCKRCRRVRMPQDAPACPRMPRRAPFFAKRPNEASSCSCIPNGDQCSLLCIRCRACGRLRVPRHAPPCPGLAKRPNEANSCPGHAPVSDGAWRNPGGLLSGRRGGRRRGVRGSF